MSVDKCNADVYKHGVSLGLFDMPKDQAEAWCVAETKRTGLKHDWHYSAGRVHIKYLPATQPQQAIERCKCGYPMPCATKVPIGMCRAPTTQPQQEDKP